MKNTSANSGIFHRITTFFIAGNPEPGNLESERKTALVNIITAAGVMFLVPYGLVALSIGQSFQGAVDLCAALLLIVANIYSRATRNLTFGKYFCVTVMCLLYLYLYSAGATNNTGPLWLFTQPLFVLFLLGSRSGTVYWIVFFITLVIVSAVPDGSPLRTASYTQDFRIRFLSAFLAVSIVGYVYEHTRLLLHRRMNEKRIQLEGMLADLLQTQTAFHESENRLRDISLSSSDWIWEIDTHGLFTFVSGRVEEGLGLDPNTLKDASLFDLMETPERDAIREQINAAIRDNGRITDASCWIKRPDGRRICMSISALAFTDSSGTVCGLRGVGKDITTQKQSEEERTRIEETMRTSQKMEAVGQLAGGIAHDFNNILGSISGYAEMISRRIGETDAKIKKYADTILSASSRAADLTSKLLAFARKGKFQTVLFNTHLIINELIDLLKLTVEKDIQVKCISGAVNPVIHGDPAQMRNVLLNLALNARDAMPDGGTLIITTENTILDESFQHAHKYQVVQGNYLCISVQDTGSGMDNATLARLFEPFFTTKDIGKGTGLGLASVYGTVKSHKGYIDVTSASGKGTTFKLYFPCSTEDLPAPAPAQKPDTPLQYGSGNILVIDDEQFLLDVSREILEKLGYSVKGFKDPAQGVDYFREHSAEIALVIIDMMMPGLNGLECFRQLRKIRPDTKAILSTGYNIEGETSEILKEGFSAMLQKPYVMSVLASTVAAVLKKT